MIKAIIFDMDGVIIDSEKIWHTCEKKYLKKFIPSISKEFQTEIIGRSIFGIYDLMCNFFPKEMKNVSREYFLKEYEKFGVKNIYQKTNLITGIKELLEKLQKKKRLALASSSPLLWINTTLNRHNLHDFFPIITSGCAVKKAKPNPEIFLTTAKKLKVEPKKCLVIEDSKNGVLAGKSAGMTVFGFRNGFNDEQDLSFSDEIITGFFSFQ